MAGNDYIAESLRAWAPLVASGYTVPAAGQVMENAATEIERLRDLFRLDGEQHAQHIKGLTEAHEARITKYATALAERDATIERLEKENDEEAALRSGAIDRMKAAEARATTAERERDEARAEVERLRKALDAIAALPDDKPGDRGGLRRARHTAKSARSALQPEGADDGAK